MIVYIYSLVHQPQWLINTETRLIMKFILFFINFQILLMRLPLRRRPPTTSCKSTESKFINQKFMNKVLLGFFFSHIIVNVLEI